MHSSRLPLIAALGIFILLSGCSSIKSAEEPEPTVEEMYAEAKKSFDKKDWVTAVDLFRKLEAKYPYGAHAEQAQLDTIYAHYRNKERELAIAAADRFIKEHPTHDEVSYAYYLKGLANYEETTTWLGRFLRRNDLSDRNPAPMRNAYNAFRDVHTQFPDSRYAPDSLDRTNYLANSLARHELVVANYYYHRNAHAAVVNRAKAVIDNFSNTPTVEDALGFLLFSYQRMGLTELAVDAKRVLEESFPQSLFLGQDGEAQLTDKWYSAAAAKRITYDRPFFR